MKCTLFAAILAAFAATAAFADRTANRDWVARNFAPSNLVPRVEALEDAVPPVTSVNGKTGAVELGANDVGAVPYSGATGDVDLLSWRLNACSVWSPMGFYYGNIETMELTGAYCGDMFNDGTWNYYYLPWSSNYGQDPSHDLALRSDIPQGGVPYSGATNDVNLGWYNLIATSVYSASGGIFCGSPDSWAPYGGFHGDSFSDDLGNAYFLPWSGMYGQDPEHDIARRSDIAAAIPQGAVTTNEWGDAQIKGRFTAEGGLFAYYYCNVNNGNFSTDYQADCVYPGEIGPYFFPWSYQYGQDPSHDFAMRSDVAAIEVTSEKLIGLVQSMSDAQKAALKAALGFE